MVYDACTYNDLIGWLGQPVVILDHDGRGRATLIVLLLRHKAVVIHEVVVEIVGTIVLVVFALQILVVVGLLLNLISILILELTLNFDLIFVPELAIDRILSPHLKSATKTIFRLHRGSYLRVIRHYLLCHNRLYVLLGSSSSRGGQLLILLGRVVREDALSVALCEHGRGDV